MALRRRMFEWAALVALWMVLVFKVDDQNFVAASAAALLTIIAISVGCRYLNVTYSCPSGWAHAVAGLPWKVVVDTWQVFKALARYITGRDRAEGQVMTVPFDYGSRHPDDTARLAITLYGISITPNTLAIETTPDGILIHQLQQVPGPPNGRDPRWPV